MKKKEIFDLIDQRESYSVFFKFYNPMIFVAICYGYIAWLDKSASSFLMVAFVFMGIDAARRSYNHRLKEVISKLIDELESSDEDRA